MTIAHRPITDEHELYPIHEEDSLPVRPHHEYQVRLLRSILRARLPQYWTTGDVCMYWEDRAVNRYVAPDVLVVDRAPEPEPIPVFLAWRDGPALLVIEVGSKSTLKEDEGPKVERYLLDLGVKEYIYYRPHRTARRRSLRMWRLAGEDTIEVAPNPAGRFPSESLGLEFGLDENLLRVYERDGTVIPTPEERAAALEQEVARLREELRRRNQAS